MTRALRFRLSSLLVATLTAAILLGANLVPRVTDHKDSAAPAEVSCWGPVLPIIRLPETQRHSAIVRVSQGWPLTVREEDAFVRVATPISSESNLREYGVQVTRWTWSDGVTLDMPSAALNGVAILIAAFTLLIGVEMLLRRRDRIQIRISRPCVLSSPARPDSSDRI